MIDMAKRPLRCDFRAKTANRVRYMINAQKAEHGKLTSQWTLSLAAEICFEQGMTGNQMSIETIRQALKRLGVGWQRAKHWISSVRRVGAYEIPV